MFLLQQKNLGNKTVQDDRHKEKEGQNRQRDCSLSIPLKILSSRSFEIDCSESPRESDVLLWTSTLYDSDFYDRMNSEVGTRTEKEVFLILKGRMHKLAIALETVLIEKDQRLLRMLRLFGKD